MIRRALLAFVLLCAPMAANAQAISQLPQAPLPLASNAFMPVVVPGACAATGGTCRAPVSSVGAGATTVPDGDLLANVSGATAPAQGVSASNYFDYAYCKTVGYLIVRLTGGWTCSNSIPLSVVWEGADPTGVTDSTAAINAALATCASIYFPPGTYKTSATLTITCSQKVEGAGRNSTIIEPSSGTFDIVSCSTSGGYIGTLFENFSINGTNVTGGNGLTVNNCNKFVGEHLQFSGPYNGIYVTHQNNVDFVDVNFDNIKGSYGIFWDGRSGVVSNVMRLERITGSGSGTIYPDGIVLDGHVATLDGFSVAWTNVGHGLWLKNTTSTQIPQFVNMYSFQVDPSNAENVRTDAGASIHFTDSYLHASATADNVYVASGVNIFSFTGGQSFGSVTGNCFNLNGSNATIQGAVISNCAQYGVLGGAGATDINVVAPEFSGNKLGNWDNLTGFNNSNFMVASTTQGGLPPIASGTGGLAPVENAITNFLVDADDLTVSAGWTLSAATIGTGAGTGPNGYPDAQHLEETTSNSTHQARQNISTLSTSTIYTGSCAVYPAERTFGAINMTDWAGASSQTIFSLSGSGSVTQTVSGALYANVKYYPATGWYVIWEAINTNTGATNPSFQIRTALNGTSASYTGTAGSGILVAGCDVTAGIGPSSHISTLAQTVSFPAGHLNPSSLPPRRACFDKVTQTTGLTLQVPDWCEVVVLHATGTLAAMTIDTPVNPIDGQELQIYTDQTISAFTVTASAGQTVNNAPSAASFAINTRLLWRWDGGAIAEWLHQ